MVSAVQWHKSIPKDVTANLLWRRRTLHRMSQDPAFAKTIHDRCSQDILFWINGFAWTFDPRPPSKSQSRLLVGKIPMVTHGFQDLAIINLKGAIERGEDRLIEKSRDMGASWICLLVFLWFWLYRPYQTFLVGSRNQYYVDSPGNHKCLFWKLDFVLKHLPKSLLPNFARTKNNLSNLDNDSAIDGEAANDDFGSGDRRTAILLDEFAKVQKGIGTWTSTRDVSNCRIVNSTHKGTGTAYYKVSTTGIEKIRMHWSDHPEKAVGLYTKRGDHYVFIDSLYWSQIANPEEVAADLDSKILAKGVLLTDGKLRSPWYALQCERAAHAFEIAQELDIDVMGSDQQFFLPQVVEEYKARHGRRPTHVGEIEYDYQTLEPIGWRENPRGRFKLWMELDPRGFPLIQAKMALSADVAAGTGASNAAMSGANRDTREKVLGFADPHIRPEEFGKLAVATAKWLGKAFMIWEQNGPGRQFGSSVVETGYRNIFFRSENDEKVAAKMTMVPGVAPTKAVKLVWWGNYRRSIEQETFVNHCVEALDETLQYVYTTNGGVAHAGSRDTVDASGAADNHGDRATADALVWIVIRDKEAVKAAAPKQPVNPPPGSFGYRQKQRRKRRAQGRRETMWTR